MISSNREFDRVDCLVAGRDRRLGQDIVAVIQALEAEGGSGACLSIQFDSLKAAVRHLLLQLECCAFEGFAVLVDLVHIHLVGEGDNDILRCLLGLLARLAFLINIRVAAVFQLTGVDIARLAKDCVLIEDCGEEDFDFGLIQVCVVNLVLTVAPGQLQVEGMLVLRQLIIFHSLSVDRHRGDLIHGKALLHRVMEGDEVCQIIRYVVRQCRGQSVRNFIADVIVGGILPF